MSYLLTYYLKGDMYCCSLARANGAEHVLSALMTPREMEAFIQMIKLLDPATVVEQSR